MFLRFLEGGGEWGCQDNGDQGFLEWASVVFGRRRFGGKKPALGRLAAARTMGEFRPLLESAFKKEGKSPAGGGKGSMWAFLSKC